MENTKYIVTGKESVAESITKDCITFGFLLFCIWVSRGSRAWTVVCAVMFFAFLFAKSLEAFNSRTLKFKDKAELLKWAQEAK